MRREWEMLLSAVRGASVRAKGELEASAESLAPPLTTSRGTRDPPVQLIPFERAGCSSLPQEHGLPHARARTDRRRNMGFPAM